MPTKVPLDERRICEKCGAHKMRRSEKGYLIALGIFSIFGGVFATTARTDEMPAWLERFPEWVGTSIFLAGLVSFFVLMIYTTLDTKRSYTCRACGYKMDIHKPWPKWVKGYFVFIGFALAIFFILLLGLGVVMLFDLSVA